MIKIKKLIPLLLGASMFVAGCSSTKNAVSTQPLESIVKDSVVVSVPVDSSKKTLNSSLIYQKSVFSDSTKSAIDTITTLNGDDNYIQAKALQEEALTEYNYGNEEKARKLFDKSVKLFLQSGISADEWIFLDQLGQMERLEQYRQLKFDINNNGVVLTPEDISAARDDLREMGGFELGARFTERVAYYKKKFLTKDKAWFERSMSRGGKYFNFIDSLLTNQGLDHFFKWMYPIESAMIETARSRVGAGGIAQFMPSTAKLYGLKIYGLWYDERSDPVKSLSASVNYLYDIYFMVGDVFLTIASYNQGESRTIKQLNVTKSSSYDELLEAGVLPRETANHLPKIYAFMDLAENMNDYDFNINFERPGHILQDILSGSFDTVTVCEQTDFDVIAEVLGVDVSVLREYNPAYKMWGTPPKSIVRDEEYAFEVRIPKGMKEKYEEEMANVKERVKKTGEGWHIVHSGETLGRIAGVYGVRNYHDIAIANKLRSPYTLRIGQRLRIPGASRRVSKTANIDINIDVDSKIPDPKVENLEEFVKLEYTVQKDDNFWSITDHFNKTYNIPLELESAVDVKDIRAWNPKYFKTNLLHPDDKLTIFIPKEYADKK
ncbi:MAG: transglycosylase SLT domain-containing protein [Nanoarchaeota archaeon]|nr:transglycosylase SLT domain-containing protein [Nanoarchaeota archaeon]MBU1270026.1 transglycosylase SLT domain-containing protein [Nanoarchaeota archaeon]MBU1604563.1 transglycosylase SLT domain-containing protein [Nanoarchaeota archaeon]MBU2443631.1 transglycosylase SLT domain-containing protein [Nanoarchaeota archaeon]